MNATGRTLIDAQEIMRPCGDAIMVGRCPLCGRNVTHSMATKNGTTCRWDGAKFDRDGKHIGYAQRRRVSP